MACANSSGSGGRPVAIGNQPKPITMRDCGSASASGPCGHSTSASTAVQDRREPEQIACAFAPQPWSAMIVGNGPSPSGT